MPQNNAVFSEARLRARRLEVEDSLFKAFKERLLLMMADESVLFNADEWLVLNRFLHRVVCHIVDSVNVK